MFEVDDYLGKRFHLKRYNCWHFARDVWRDITGEQLYDFTPPFLDKEALTLAAEDARHKFVRVTGDALQPLLVLATTPCDSPHIGVLYNGRVLHLRQAGALYEKLDSFKVGFTGINFYTTVR